MSQPGSAISTAIDNILLQTKGQPSEVQRKAVTDAIYNSLWNALEAFALEEFGANSKNPNYTSRDTTLWVYPRNFASDVAGSVNQALQPILDAKLRW